MSVLIVKVVKMEEKIMIVVVVVVAIAGVLI